MTPHIRRADETVIRYLALYELRKTNSLAGLTLQEIADQFGVNRSTIMRNLRQVHAAEIHIEHYLKKFPIPTPA